MSPDIILLVVAAALLIFMFWSSSRRRKKMQAQEQERQASLVPGTPVMTRAGLYGTLVSFDADDLTKRAVIAIAPGVEVEVHAQSVTIDQESLQAAESDGEPADDEPFDDVEEFEDVEDVEETAEPEERATDAEDGTDDENKN